MAAYDEVIEYTELPLDIVEGNLNGVREQTPDEKREYIIGMLAIEYTKLVDTGIRDERAWNRLSRWLYDLVALQEELSHDQVAR